MRPRVFGAAVTSRLLVLVLVASAQHQRAGTAGPQRPESGPSPRGADPRLTQAVPAAAAPAVDRAVVDRYCVTCHNQRLKTGNLALDTADVNDIAGQAELWEKVVTKIRGGSMPPPGRPRPD